MCSFTREEWRLFVFLVLSYVLAYWMSNFTLYRYVITNPAQLVPLHDLGFDLIPRSYAQPLYSIINMIPILSIVVSLLIIQFYGSRAVLIDLMRRGTVVFLLKNVCQVLTVVPHSEALDCFKLRIDSSGDTSKNDHIGWWMMYEGNIFSNCSDMMWSNHTALTLEAFHGIYAVFGGSWWLFTTWLVVFCTLVGCMLAVRYHYSMDIFVATVIVFLAFRDVRPGAYHHILPERDPKLLTFSCQVPQALPITKPVNKLNIIEGRKTMVVRL